MHVCMFFKLARISVSLLVKVTEVYCAQAPITLPSSCNVVEFTRFTYACYEMEGIPCFSGVGFVLHFLI